MIVFPNAKINIGLHIIKKRDDGFHALQTVFYPVNWCDALEVIENKQNNEPFVFTHSGLPISGESQNNLIWKAWRLVKEIAELPPLKVHLHKNIPMGAGLGGGSSDAIAFIQLLDNQFSLKLTVKQKYKMALQLGSDCPFFLENESSFAEGRGEELKTIRLDLSAYFILIVYPNIHSNTKEAFEGVLPKAPPIDLKKTVSKLPVRQWKDTVINDFEQGIFSKYDTIKTVKEQLYKDGALFASLSGSGSAVYGIFDFEPPINLPSSFAYYLQKPPLKKL